MSKSYVYFFAPGRTDGSAELRDLLGGKGANLAEMTRLGIPVPPGFTISTEACRDYYRRGRKLPPTLRTQVKRAMTDLEELRGKRFGAPDDPLLVSVRSGAKFSMPGMMDTILNLGLNDRSVKGLARSSGNPRFAYDSYRRLIQMYGDVVLGVPKREFETLLAGLKRRRGVEADTDLVAEDLEKLVRRFKDLVRRRTKRPFPQDPWRQLWGAIGAVFASWDNERARVYRRQYGIPDDLGTAVNVQSMVFGNLGDDCATGVAFTRNPATGENELYGEYLPNAQGEDVVAGIRTPLPISRKQGGDPGTSLEERMPACYRELLRIRKILENHYRDMQDIEFTIERGALYMLQTRTGKRTGLAALRIAFDFHRARKIDRNTVLLRIEPEQLVQLLAPVFDPAELERARREGRRLARGLPAGPGAASGRLATTAQRAREMAEKGDPVILVREETSPEDVAGMLAAAGIVTSRGGMTSHAAVVARGMGKPCVVGAGALVVDEERGRVRAAGHSLREGDWISLDGTTGEVFVGRMSPNPSEVLEFLLTGRRRSKAAGDVPVLFQRLMRWSDGVRRLGVRTNADTPRDARVARALGAEGIGLCRTEHMFFAEDRIPVVRHLILAEDEKDRSAALRRLLPMQRRDFVGIFKAMDGLPVTIRLLDPPLHEFLPTDQEQFRSLAKEMGVPASRLREKAEQLRELNPMLGHRGCRLGITFPEIYDMQVRAILEAASVARKRGVRAIPEIMVPLVGTLGEMEILEKRIRRCAEEVQARVRGRLRFQVGTMMEVPRACLIAAPLAARAEFFSFGTNDLTQMVFGYSRDDAGKFLPAYVERRILPKDPFESLDREGVGRLVRLAIAEGREVRKDLKVGVCGEHGGDPASVVFFHEAGADYVSCSPYRVPVARLAAAQAALRRDGEAVPGTA